MELKNRIIQSAYELFSTKGFQKTTITDIVKASGTSKGGFYHHFNSKEEIVNHIMELYLQDVLTFFDELYERYNNDLIKVFNGVFESINQFKKNQFDKWPEMLRMLSFPGNDLIIMRMSQSFEESTIKFYTDVIKKGNGVIWHVASPENIAGLWARELIRIYSKTTQTLYDWREETITELTNLLEFNENLINTLLGITSIEIKEEVLHYLYEAHDVMQELEI